MLVLPRAGGKLRKTEFRAADPNGNGLCSLAELETWVMMVIACFTNLIGSVGCILFLRKIYFGLDPLTAMIMTSTITDLL